MAIQIYDFNLDSNQKELEVRGTLMFPCSAYVSDIVNNTTKDIPWHWHEEIELILIKKGCIQVGLNGIYYSLKAGDGIFINSNILHAAHIINEHDCMLNSLVFHPNLVSGTAESIFEQQYIRPLVTCHELPGIAFFSVTPWHQEALDCIEKAYEAYETQAYGFELIVREKLTRLWYLILMHHQSQIIQTQTTENQDAHRIKQMISYLQQHFTENIELKHIANVASISERECLRCFQKTIGMSPIQYLLKYRISVAAQLLKNSNQSP